MSLDIDALRANTPGCEHVAHFNNAGAGLMPLPVLDAIQGHLTRESIIGGYEAHDAAEEAYQDTYRALEELFGAKKGEIALLENATRAWDQIFYGMIFRPGDRVITAQASYASNYIAMLQQAKRFDIEIDVIPNDKDGQVDVSLLKAAIGDRTRLICLTHVPTNGGLINPAAEVGVVARRHNIPYLLDACQSVGQIHLDVDEIGCDFLSGTGRKYLRGPRGTGFLYVRASSLDLVEPPFLDLHAATWTERNGFEMLPDAGRFENWEGYVAGKIGLGAAVRYLLELGQDEVYARIRMLAARLREELRSLSGITVHDLGSNQCGIVTFSHDTTNSEKIKSALDKISINVSLSHPEWTKLDSEVRNLPVMIRASVHAYNTEEEVARFVGEIHKISELR